VYVEFSRSYEFFKPEDFKNSAQLRDMAVPEDVFRCLRQYSEVEGVRCEPPHELLARRRYAAEEERARREVAEREKHAQIAKAAHEEHARREAFERAERTRREQGQQQELAQRQAERQKLLVQLQEHLEQRFLSVDSFYRSSCTAHISADEYQTKKVKFVTSWAKRHLRFAPDDEQAAAIGAVDGHVQVVARAGSGKTSTLVNRALFLQQHCGVAPHELLLLAFNRKAAEEMRNRLADKLTDTIPHAMTFHALAYALVRPEEAILVDEPGGERNKSRALQSVIDDYLRTEEGYATMRILMTAHFRGDWERIVSGGYEKSPDELLRYRRALPRQAIDGMYVKSFGEKLIADFLFEHDIKNRYEQNHWWNGTNYRPDFTLPTSPKSGLIIEYFGRAGNPEYDQMSVQKRKYWNTKPNWQLIEFFPSDLAHGKEIFRDRLKHTLERHGIKCERLSENEIWNRIKDRAVDRFTSVVDNFIRRCRKQWLTPNELAALIARHPSANTVEQRFLDLVQVFYESYLARLQATGEDDFDGLLQQAIVQLQAGSMLFRRKSGSGDLGQLRYILIDEYQDFSALFHQLIVAVRKHNSHVQVFCVGDDWQAINSFAGSDIEFFRTFDHLFQPAQQLSVATNYRSAQSIVETGNALMHGHGTRSRASRTEIGIVSIADLATFEPTPQEKETHPNDILTPAVLRLVRQAIDQDHNIVLLSRKHSLPWYVNYGARRKPQAPADLDDFLGLIRANLPESGRKRVSISTAHGYKGLEQQTVIVLDAVTRSYPLVHPDLMFTRVLGDTLEKVIDEERRLLYVALTRATEHLVICTEKGNESPFLTDLQRRALIPALQWPEYQAFSGNAKRITVRVGNQDGRSGRPTLAIKDLLKAHGYNWTATGWRAWSRTYSEDGFSEEQFIAEAMWSANADGIEVRISDDTDNVLAIYHINKGGWELLTDDS